LISNKYYITTIIAIFLSLSLGILIGGTLGQQWINENQQEMIVHFQEKARELEQKNEQLLNKHQALILSYSTLKEEYQDLFYHSVAHMMDGTKILWINLTDRDLTSLRDSLMTAGSMVFGPQRASGYDQLNGEAYDIVLFIANNQEELVKYSWALKYSNSVVYIGQQEAKDVSPWNETITRYDKSLSSYHDHYQFISFLKTFIEEKNNNETKDIRHHSGLQ